MSLIGICQKEQGARKLPQQKPKSSVFYYYFSGSVAQRTEDETIKERSDGSCGFSDGNQVLNQKSYQHHESPRLYPNYNYKYPQYPNCEKQKSGTEQ